MDGLLPTPWAEAPAHDRQVSDLPLATARDEAERELHRIALGEDPAAEQQAERATFGDTVAALIDAYEKKSSKKRSWKEERRILMNEIVPVWGQRLVRDITRRDVRELVEAKAETAPIMANRILSRLSRLFNYALAHDWIESNPAHRVPKPARETSRDRVLTPKELAELWVALGQTVAKAEDGRPLLLEDGRPVPRLVAAVSDAFKVMLMTAQRSGEVCRMRWADVDLEKGWWTIPATQTKNADEHRVPLSPPVLKILTRRRAEADTAFEKQKPKPGKERRHAIYVFANGTGTRSIADRAKKAASFLSNGGLSFAFRAHDLRRTAASGMAEAGVPRDHIAHVLNHRSVTEGDRNGGLRPLHVRPGEKGGARRLGAFGDGHHVGQSNVFTVS